MKPFILCSLIAAGLACCSASAGTPVEVKCLPGSDTYVGLPASIPTPIPVSLTAQPTSNVIFISPTLGQFANTHYAKFSSGPDAGMWFTITANTATELTLDLGGFQLTADTGDSLEIIKFWTLGELFPPGLCTSDPATTQTAVVASLNPLANGRRTQILIPGMTACASIWPPTAAYYLYNSHWRRVGAPAATDFDSTQLIPDRFFIVHHPTSVTQATTYKVNAHDDIYKFNVRLLTCSTSRQETPVGLLRPVDLELNDLNLGGTPAFMTSLSMLISGRRDELLMYDNAAAGFNKGPSARYFYFDGKWLKQGAGNADHGGDVIPAGWGFVIRKYSGTGASVNWTLPE